MASVAPLMGNEAIAHRGFPLVEVISDCTGIFGRKSALGNAPETVLRQRVGMPPKTAATR